MSNLIAALTKGRVVLAFFIATQVVYLAMVLITLPHLRGLAGGMEPFDLLPGGYDLDYAKRFLEAIGSEGRAFYLSRQIPLDLIYPGLFAITYAIIWIWVLAKVASLSLLLRMGAILPILAGLADYVENAFIATMLRGFPSLSEGMVTTASLFTVIKSTATILYFAALLGLAVTVAVRKFKGRKS